MQALNQELYPQIFKRKSFHIFRNLGNARLGTDELEDIQRAFSSFIPLYPEIRTELRILPANKIRFKGDAEYCLLIYSEKKENYLMNVGYLGQQLDLYLVQHNIGSLWYGIGKPDTPDYNGLSYVIMFAIHKVDDEKLFRKDMFKAKRKPLEAIWQGETMGIAEIARFAPSACNSQPWLVKHEGNIVEVYRYKKQNRVGLMTPAIAFYFNRIDIGIFLCVLELCMVEKGMTAERELFADTMDVEYSLVARYVL